MAGSETPAKKLNEKEAVMAKKRGILIILFEIRKSLNVYAKNEHLSMGNGGEKT